MINILGNNRHRIRRDDIVYSGIYSGYFTGGLDYNFNLNTPVNGFYLQTPYTSDFDLSTGDIIIEANFNATSFTHGMALIAKDTYGINFDWALMIENNTTLRMSTATTSQNLYVTVPPMNTGQWYHFKFERISGVNTIYLDGVAYGSNTMSITNMSTVNITVGTTSYNNPGYHFEGYLDNVHISRNGIDVMNLTFASLNSSDQFIDDTGKLWTIHPEPYVNIIRDCVDIVRDGLVLHINPVNLNCYPRTGSSIYNLENLSEVGTLTNGATWNSTTGVIDLDGVNDFIEFGDILDLGLNSMTVNCWVKLNSNTGVQVLCSKSFQATGNYRFNVAINGQKIYAFMNGTSDVEAFGDTILPINEWIQITATFDRLNGIKLYLNGVIDITTIPDISMWSALDFQSNHPLRIGSYTDIDNVSPIFNVDGKIGYTQLYHRVLSASENYQNYKAIKPYFE